MQHLPIVRNKYNSICYDPFTVMALASIAGAGATAYSASQERKSAEKAADAQRDIAQQQIDATKESELLAQETATKKLKLARAKKSQTILTAPDLEGANVNLKKATGV